MNGSVRRAAGACVVGAACLTVPPAAAEPNTPGITTGGTPGIHRVGVAAARGRGLALAGTVGGGFIEAQNDSDGTHTRFAGTLAAGLAPIRGLDIGLRFDGRLDQHPDDGMGTDDGLVGDPKLLGRYGGLLSPTFHLGGELVLWLPGGDAPSLPLDAATVDLNVLPAYVANEGGPTIGGLVGFRLDNSANAVENPDQLRFGDRLALGLSEFHAVLVGVGLSYPVGPIEVLAELSGGVLIGGGAPGLMESPLRASVGGRYHASDALQLELLADVSLSSRPPVGAGEPVVPIEPRVMGWLGVRYDLSFEPPPTADEKPDEEQPIEVDEPVDTAPQIGGVSLAIVDADGNPVSGAQVTLDVAGESRQIEESEGAYGAGELPAGEAEVKVTAEAFQPATQTVRIEPGGVVEARIQLEPVPQGQLRGLVRTYGGRGLKAAIKVEPGDHAIEADGEGYFTLDLPPGDYEVEISAKGYRTQKRKVSVENGGVTVLNADMIRGR